MSGSDRLFAAIAAVLGVDAATLTDDSSPETVAEWDSLNHLNIVMGVEGEFNVSLSAEDVLEMRTVGAIRTILAARGAEV